MLIKEVDQKITEVQGSINNLRKLLKEEEGKRDYLKSLRDKKRLDYFTQFIEIDSEYEFDNFNTLQSVTFVSKKPSRRDITIHGSTIYFNNRDVIKFIKKNQKTIVCEYIKKDGVALEIDIRFRVNKEELFSQIISNPQNKEKFDIFVSRCESFEALEI